MAGPLTDLEALQRIHELELPGYGDDEIQFIAAVMRELLPELIVDWGTNVGSSARIFLELAPFGCQVHTIEHPDPLTHDHPGGRYAMHSQGTHVVHHLGDGVELACGLYGAQPLARTLMFLDGDHRYHAVLKELIILAHAAPRAWLLVHDYRHPVEETSRAVDEFVAGHRYNTLVLESQAGMVLLCPR